MSTYPGLLRRSAPVVLSLGLVACAAEAPQPGVATDGFTAEICEADRTPAGLDLARRTVGVRFDAFAVRSGRTSVGGEGTLCATATDRATCEAALDALGDYRGGWATENEPRRFFVASNASGLHVAGTAEELAPMLAPVTTFAAAVLLADAKHFHVDCPGARSLRSPDALEFVAVTGRCDLGVYEHRLRVSTAGDLVSTARAEIPQPACSGVP